MSGLPDLDPFKEIEVSGIGLEVRAAPFPRIQESSKYSSDDVYNCDSESEVDWVEENGGTENRNIFGTFDDEQDY